MCIYYFFSVILELRARNFSKSLQNAFLTNSLLTWLNFEQLYSWRKVLQAAHFMWTDFIMLNLDSIILTYILYSSLVDLSPSILYGSFCENEICHIQQQGISFSRQTSPVISMVSHTTRWLALSILFPLEVWHSARNSGICEIRVSMLDYILYALAPVYIWNYSKTDHSLG